MAEPAAARRMYRDDIAWPKRDERSFRVEGSAIEGATRKTPRTASRKSGGRVHKAVGSNSQCRVLKHAEHLVNPFAAMPSALAAGRFVQLKSIDHDRR
jgi:hypothetical protein